MTTLKITTSCEHDAPIEECREAFAAHPEIAARAPRWAREVCFHGIYDDGYIGWIYKFEDDDVQIAWGWQIENGIIAHARLEDDPDTSLAGDILFEIVADYIEARESREQLAA